MRKIKYLLCFCVVLLFCCGCQSKSYLTKTSEASSMGQEEMEETTKDTSAKEKGTESKSSEDEQEATPAGEIYVQVCGAVLHPGVYPLATGSRVYEAIALAGGVTSEAYEFAFNQAEVLSDGQCVYVPTKDEVAAGQNAFLESNMSVNLQGNTKDNKVNINQASVDELTTLTGIGESKAKAIIAYRQEHGEFSSPEDLKQVSGIGEGTYAKIADEIKVH